jgi:outer membrane protein assembly factor BamB
MKSGFVCCWGTFLAFCATLPAIAENWPAWRGPQLSGVASEKDLPLTWSENENVRWRVDLPGPGNSSPIVWGDRVFVSQAVETENRRTLMCFDRSNGQLLWQKGVTYTDEEPTHDTNPYCAGTPATDGEYIYVCFGSPGVYAYDFDGNEVWHRDLGKLRHIFGTAVSPILYGDVCIVNFGPGEGARLVALNKQSGDIEWEVQPPAVDPSELAPRGGGFGGRGGPGGFGPGAMLAPQILSQADKNDDQKLTPDEFSALGASWFEKLDADKSGQLSQEQFVDRLSEVLPPPETFGPPRDDRREGGPDRGARRGFGPARFIGPGLFTALDSNKDGSLTRAEMNATFGKWSSEWDSEKSGALTERQLRDGLSAALPRPNFGGPGAGPGRGPGGRGGPGGPGAPGGGRGPGGAGGFAQFGGSWSTPIIVRTNGRDELIFSFPGRLVAYDPQSGQQLWISKGLGGTIYTTPVSGESAIVAMSSGPGGGDAIAVRPGGNGDVTESQRIWRLERIESQMGSGVIHDAHLYTVSQQGIATCIDLQSGKTVWEKRLRGPGSRGGSWSSILLADGKIYIPNQSGDVFVLAASPTFELLATNSVDEPTNASLAASNGDLIMRTDNSLWCFTADR